MPLLLANFIYSRDCKLNLRKNVDTTLLCIRDRLLFDENGATPILTIKRRSVLSRILKSCKNTPHGPSGET